MTGGAQLMVVFESARVAWVAWVAWVAEWTGFRAKCRSGTSWEREGKGRTPGVAASRIVAGSVRGR